MEAISLHKSSGLIILLMNFIESYLYLVNKANKKELKKASGDVFFEAWRAPDNAFIYVNWIGIQSMETIVMGGNQVLNMLRDKPCPAILNSNRELVGPWDVAVSWLKSRWAPQASELGVRYYAHVLSPGIFGKRSFEQLHPSLKAYFKVKSYEDESMAEEWIYLKVM